MNFGDLSVYPGRRSQPQPAPTGGPTRLSWRAPLMLVAMMFGWMLFSFTLAAATAPDDPNAQAAVGIGYGVVVTPAPGWYSAGNVWDPGPDSISLQRAGAYVAIWVEGGFRGTNEDLLNYHLDQARPDFRTLRILPTASTTVAGGLPALTVLFSGESRYWGAENEMVVAVTADLGVVMMATAARGQLARVQKDLDAMLATMIVPR